MNRRRFLRFLGAGVAVGVVAPAAVIPVLESAPVAKTGYATYVMGQDAIISQYADYTDYASFSESARVAVFAEETQKFASELAYRFIYATDVVQGTYDRLPLRRR
jgi:hypothetical protein